MDIFPYILVRTGGGPFEALEHLAYQPLADGVQNIWQLQQRTTVLGSKMSKELLVYIQSATRGSPPHWLQQLRRDVHNGRMPRPAILAAAKSLLPEEYQRYLFEYIQTHAALIGAMAMGAKLYETALEKGYIKIQHLAQQDNLQKGLLLSSQSLLSRLPAFLAKEPSSFRKKEVQTAQGLLLYLARMHAKTTPFSTFTNLYLPGLSTTNSGHCIVRQNHAILQALAQTLKGSSARPYLKLQVNTSCTIMAGHFVFFINRDNQETFNHIAVTPLLHWLKKEAQRQPEGIAFGTIVSALQETTEVSYTEAAVYIQQLIEAGFLVYHLQTQQAGLHWPNTLLECLTNLPVQRLPEVAVIKKLLQQLHQVEVRYPAATCAERQTLLQSCFTQLQVVSRLPTASPTLAQFGPEQLLYEDTAQYIPISVDAKNIQPIIEKLQALMQSLPLFEHHTAARQTLKNFVVQQYGEGARIDLLTLYKAYYQLKPPLPETFRQRQWQWAKALATSLGIAPGDTPKQIYLSQAHIQAANTAIGINTYPAVSSNAYGGLLQIYEANGQSMAVVQDTFAGYGHMLGRFLPLFGKKAISLQQQWNQRLKKAGILWVKNHDASHQNANLSPSLWSLEINTPGVSPTLPPNCQIPIQSLLVAHEKTTDTLHLIHGPSGQQIAIANTGLERLSRRSGLYQFLALFSPERQLPITPVADAICYALTYGQKSLAQSLPRIIYEGQLVLQRKSWRIPAEEIMRLKSADNWQSYLNVQVWQRKWNLPTHLFVRVSGAAANISRASHKPMYIHLGQPTFVQLLQKTAKQATKSLLHFEEMLPTPAQLLSIRQQRFVSEYLVQWIAQ